MLSQRKIETFVGILLLAAILSLLTLAFKVSGLTGFFKSESYSISAQFDDVGQLKVRAAVKMGGVSVGEVSDIRLDPSSYKAIVTMHISSTMKDIPNDSVASILTSGLLGDNYIELQPMYSTEFLKEGGQIEETHSAMILEKLIGQLIFKLSNGSSEEKTTAKSNSHPPVGGEATATHHTKERIK